MMKKKTEMRGVMPLEIASFESLQTGSPYGPSAPVMTTSPARSGVPRWHMVSASQRAALSGWPRQAAPSPVATVSPSTSIRIGIVRRSTSRSGTPISVEIS